MQNSLGMFELRSDAACFLPCNSPALPSLSRVRREDLASGFIILLSCSGEGKLGQVVEARLKKHRRRRLQ